MGSKTKQKKKGPSKEYTGFVRLLHGPPKVFYMGHIRVIWAPQGCYMDPMRLFSLAMSLYMLPIRRSCIIYGPHKVHTCFVAIHGPHYVSIKGFMHGPQKGFYTWTPQGSYGHHKGVTWTP